MACQESGHPAATAVMSGQCTAHSTSGLVAAAAPVAARIGADALGAGGNAIDAAIAAAFAETVLLPPKCGIAGDLIALVWRRGEPEPAVLLAIGGAPAGLAAAARRGVLEPTGPTSVGVPGAPAGYERLGEASVLGLPTLAAPAIELARDGFVWSPICTLLSEEALALVGSHNPTGSTYFPDGKPILPGTVTRLPGLGDAIERLADDPGGFLDGEVGQAIARRVREAGGVLDHTDMQYSTAEWVAPARAIGPPMGPPGTRYWATPAPTHGPSLLDVVRDFAGRTNAHGHLDEGDVYRSVLGSIARRRAELSDPSGTSMVSAVDRDRTMVTLVHSNSFPRYGSGLIVDGFDLVLSNRAGRGFSTDPKHPNFPDPGRRPATTLHAWAVTRSDGVRVQGATPGGANQMPWNAQTLANLIRDPAAVGQAVVGPRWEWQPDDDGVRVEAGFPPEQLDSLLAEAPTAGHVARWGLRSAMQILVDPGPGRALSATVDPRTGGAVIAR